MIYRIVSSGGFKEVNKLRSSKINKGISVVIATYNEEGNIENLIKEVRKYVALTEFRNSFEIVVVDDSSQDKTPKIINKLAKKGFIIAVHRKKKGLFSAIVDGVKVAKGEYVLTMDSDFSHPPELIPEMVKNKKYDIVSGSRFVKGGGIEAPFLKKIGTNILNRICGLIMGLSVRDLGGDFHFLRKNIFLSIPFKYRSQFGEFSFELFYWAKQMGLSIKEAPFLYRFRQKGESKTGGIFKQIYYSIVYFKRAFQLRQNSR